MANDDRTDAGLIKLIADGLREWAAATGRQSSAKPLREAIWFYWQQPRLPRPLFRSKYPLSYPWSKDARDAYRHDRKNCRLVIEHAVPVKLVIGDLLAKERSVNHVIALLKSGLDVCVVMTSEEDRAIANYGFQSRMPEGWTPGDDPYARYRAAGFDPDTFESLVD